MKVNELFNNYNGAPYEGMKLYSFNFNDVEANKFISVIKKSWNKLPLTEDVAFAMYGGTKDGQNYSYDFANRAGLPRIKQGYWSLENDHESILNQYSFDFVLAIYDIEQRVLYLFKINT